jgi:hypothetical protein
MQYMNTNVSPIRPVQFMKCVAISADMKAVIYL